MTGRTKAEQDGGWIANIMIFMCCMQKHGIHGSCLSGDAFCTLLDMANRALPTCSLLTLPGERFPIFGILLSPFRFHIGLRLVGEYPVRYNVITGTPVSWQVLCCSGVATLE